MKKTLLALFAVVAIAVGVQASFAACPCQTSSNPCPCAKPAPCDPCAKPCDPCAKPAPCDPCACNEPCCEDWLCPQVVEDYFCRIGLSECQKDEARKAIEEFKCSTSDLRGNGCKCESKCDCRAYRKALRDLDCKMKTLITKCQKSDYKCVRSEVKGKVKCCHKCLINPFSRCKCSCK